MKRGQPSRRPDAASRSRPKGKVNASRQVPVLIPIDWWTDIGKASPDLTRPSEKDRDDA
ncbi:hypothetical protein ACXIUS_11905 [Bosea thiooxidans]|nr:hypothetical protein [Bosea sp. (in: a-proteobacteria)]